MSKSTIDHDEIREWAESKGGKPAAVDRTHEGGDVGIIRLMFPDNKQSEHGSLVEISWDEFFAQFDEAKLALLYEENSLFSKLIGRDTLEKREHGDHGSRHYADSKKKTDRAPAKGRASAKAGGAKAAPAKTAVSKDKSAPKGAPAKAAPAASKAKSSAGDGKHHGAGDDLKSREYTDAQGNVHHHTRAYAEKHTSK